MKNGRALRQSEMVKVVVGLSVVNTVPHILPTVIERITLCVCFFDVSLFPQTSVFIYELFSFMLGVCEERQEKRDKSSILALENPLHSVTQTGPCSMGF